MRYATWKVHFLPEAIEGSTPEMVIRARGGEASGGVSLDDFSVIGYLSDNAQTQNLTAWDFQEITETEALTLAQTLNLSYYIFTDGTFQLPYTPPKE